MPKQERVKEVTGSMASFTKVWQAIENQRKKMEDDFEIKLDYLEKRVARIESKLGEALNRPSLIQPTITEAIGKVV